MTRLTIAAMVLACVEDGGCHPALDPESFGYIYAGSRDLSIVLVEQGLRAIPPAPAGT